MRRLLVSVALLLGACAGQPAPQAASPSAASGAAPVPVSTEASPVPGPAPVVLVAILNAQQPLPGVVTGGQPTDEQLREAKAAGYKTVISLLPESDTVAEATVAKELGLRFVSIPVRNAEDLTEANARLLGEALNAADAKPLILHCASGNRAGALLALEAFYVEHASPEDALALGDRAGLKSLRPAVEQKLQVAK